MTAVYAPWAAELLLECAGAYLNLKRSRLLALILTVCAITDIAAFLVFQFCSRSLYTKISWAQFNIKELMLIWFACVICGKFVSERNQSRAYIATECISLVTCGLVTVFAFQGDTLTNRLLNGEIAANTILLAMVWLGWMERGSRLAPDWKWYAAGFIVLVAGDLAITVLWTLWSGARHLFPITTIAAYSAWAFGPMLPARLREYRSSLGHRIAEAQKASVM